MKPDELEDPREPGELRALRALPRVDVDRAVADRTRTRARAAFVDAHDLQTQPAWIVAIHRGSRALVPVAVAGAVGTYLSWAVIAASALYP